MKEETILYTNDLSVGYNKKTLIRDIEINLQKGQILTLIGPNGSGKSTILKSITKHLDATYGTVYIDNNSINKMTEKELARKISVVFTNKLQTELVTCEDIVATGRYPYTGTLGILSKEDKIKVEESMKLVQVWDLKDRSFTAISDGQRQRILLARAISQEPDIIVLDEPTSFLDIHHKLDLLNILREMVEKQNISVIMSLHELDLAQKISDYVMCIKGEYISYQGEPNEIFNVDLIEDLYDLNNGSYNPLFGSVEMEKPKGDPDVFVIAGGGSGIDEFRLLQRKGIPFIAGIIHENDIDYQVCNVLANMVISEKAFQNICDESLEKAKAQLEKCNTVIYCLKQFGEINKRNVELLDYAIELGLTILYSASDL